MLTEILLDVTNSELRLVAEEVYERAASKQGVYTRGLCWNGSPTVVDPADILPFLSSWLVFAMIYLYPTAKLKPIKSATVTPQSLGGSSGKWDDDDALVVFG